MRNLTEKEIKALMEAGRASAQILINEVTRKIDEFAKLGLYETEEARIIEILRCHRLVGETMNLFATSGVSPEIWSEILRGMANHADLMNSEVSESKRRRME